MDDNTTFDKNALSEEQLAEVNGGLTVLDWVQHTVVYGDTLVKLAERYHSLYEAICQVNAIPNPNSLPQGLILNIPVLWR